MTELVGRLLTPEAGEPAANMALDQALLETVGKNGCPTLRFYTWNRPTLSLGYFQPLTDRRQHRESRSLDCVRRGTGGGAIIHHHELTYSVAMPVSVAHAGPREALYQQIHQAFAQVLFDLGVRAAPHRLTGRPPMTGPEPFLCFQRRTSEDLVVAGYKVLGSAQRRTRGAVLQHGSLLLRAGPFAPQLPGIADLGAKMPGLGDELPGLGDEKPGLGDEIAGTASGAESRGIPESGIQGESVRGLADRLAVAIAGPSRSIDGRSGPRMRVSEREAGRSNGSGSEVPVGWIDARNSLN